ncbi:MAG: ribosomal protein S18-alanine N-acetyltransferase [Haloarculaceae archaeon]
MTTTTPRGGADPEIRPAVRADLLEVFRIEQASFPQPWPYSAFEGFLDAPGFLVAVDEGVVGYVVADTVPNHGRPLGHLKDIAVRPDRRGEGIGASLLGGALSALTGERTSRVKLEVRAGNDEAIGLYRAFGFTHHHTVPRYYEDGEDALVMLRGF